jgi:hypothetical protein
MFLFPQPTPTVDNMELGDDAYCAEGVEHDDWFLIKYWKPSLLGYRTMWIHEIRATNEHGSDAAMAPGTSICRFI